MAGVGELSALIDLQQIRAAGRVFFFPRRLWLAVAASVAAHYFGLAILAHSAFATYPSPPRSLQLSILNTVSPDLLVADRAPRNPGDESKLPLGKGRHGNADELEVPNRPGWIPLPNNIYFPKSDLSRPPQLIEDVDLSEVSSLGGVTPGRAIMEIFIDEGGVIVRIEAETGSLAENVVENLKDRLFMLKFSSGEIDGIAVKSRIRIEVNIEPDLRFDGKVYDSK